MWKDKTKMYPPRIHNHHSILSSPSFDILFWWSMLSPSPFFRLREPSLPLRLPLLPRTLGCSESSCICATPKKKKSIAYLISAHLFSFSCLLFSLSLSLSLSLFRHGTLPTNNRESGKACVKKETEMYKRRLVSV